MSMPIESIEVPRDDEETPVERVSNRYGIPKHEVEALIAGKPNIRQVPHPLTMGTLMDKKQETETIMHDEKQSWSPIAVLGAILGVIGILSLIVLLVFILRAPKRTEHLFTKHEQSAPHSSGEVIAPAPVDTVVTPPQTIAAPEEKQSKSIPTLKKKNASPRTYLTTTNSLEAEEKLAELRAEGNKKAKINISSKNGVTTYKVQ